MGTFRGHGWRGCLEVRAHRNTTHLKNLRTRYHYIFPAQLMGCRKDAQLVLGVVGLTFLVSWRSINS